MRLALVPAGRQRDLFAKLFDLFEILVNKVLDLPHFLYFGQTLLLPRTPVIELLRRQRWLEEAVVVFEAARGRHRVPQLQSLLVAASGRNGLPFPLFPRHIFFLR